MKHKAAHLFVVTFAFLSFCSLIFGVTLTVAQDNSAQYTTIQSAISAAGWEDIVLVNPGVYQENIDYLGKHITVASLEYTTGDPAYRESTVIDGNNNGSAVNLASEESNSMIYGFTIQHGNGHYYNHSYCGNVRYGGGIRVEFAHNFTISNCIIKDNKASAGGGLYVYNGNVILKDTQIFNNFASGQGGGILFYYGAWGTFDVVDRCSVYENYAGMINDICATALNHPMDIYLDMASVNPPTDYYMDYFTTVPYDDNTFNSIFVLRGYRTEINHDLYVSPFGNDNNDGLSTATPLKTIALALHRIASDNADKKTVYLAPGEYSTDNGQIFPLCMKNDVNLVGDREKATTLINTEYKSTIMWAKANNNLLANLVLEHGNFNPTSVFSMLSSYNTSIHNLEINSVTAESGAGISLNSSYCDMDHIRLNHLTSSTGSGISFYYSNGSIRNSSINDCHNTFTFDDVMNWAIVKGYSDSHFEMENVSITNCSVSRPESSLIDLNNHYNIPGDNPVYSLRNVLVTNNSAGTGSLTIDANNFLTPVEITNCDFVYNSGDEQTIKITGNAIISNCILENDYPKEMYLTSHGSVSLQRITMNNNLIDEYPASLTTSGNMIFNEFNFDDDPGFVGNDWTDPLCYQLQIGSPCIDAGTENITYLNLPDYDLKGNDRVYGGRIDIGCYEWKGKDLLDTDTTDDTITPLADMAGLNISPNPFRQDTTIRYSLDKAQNVSLAVYNIKGQLIKSLTNGVQYKGIQSAQWDGRDLNGKTCTAGIYLVKLYENNKAVSSKKITIVK